MKPTKEDIKKWLKDIGQDRFWLAKQCGVGKRTVDSWFASDRDLPARVALLISQFMSPITEVEGHAQGRNFHRVETLTLQFSKSEWEDVLEYQKLYPKKTVQELAEEFVLNLSASLQRGLSQIIPEVEKLEITPTSSDYDLEVIGNIAAGGLQPGDTIPYAIKAGRPLGKDEYVLRVEGKSMEPVIKDGSLVIMRKHTVPPVPKVGTIVEYFDERGVTLKKLGRRKNPETGKQEYILKPLNPAFGDIEPMDGGKISAVYVETLDKWEKA